MKRDLLVTVQSIVRAAPRTTVRGRVVRLVGHLIEAHLPGGRVGALVDVERGDQRVRGEIIGFRDDVSLVFPLGDVRGIGPGAAVSLTDRVADIGVSSQLLGRVIDPFGHPLDGGPAIPTETTAPLDRPAPPVDQRLRIVEPFETGVRAIDVLLTCGRGQRVGLFAGAGVGKTMLLRQIAEQSRADATVIGLIGERGGEVRDLLESKLGPRSVVVVATSDRSALERVRGARAATAIAEHLRDQGKHVLLVLDSLTRYAMALREVGLAAGEPPATKGYPPSVFAALPQLLERASPLSGRGSITGFYTVLVEGDDLSDPVADAARSLLDGHIVLSRDLASRGHFPAINVLESASRVARNVAQPAVLALAEQARALLAQKKEADELRSLGAYHPGNNAALDEAVTLGNRVIGWSRQRPEERVGAEQAAAQLAALLRNDGKAVSR